MKVEGVVDFDVRVPVDNAGLVENVHHAFSLGLPELPEFGGDWDETLQIVAGGPSALSAPLDGPTLALNGAMRIFTQRGLAPSYWAGCDPQEALADFIPDDPPQSTFYLVASKCHPKVFEKLRGRSVIVWHVSDEATWPIVRDHHPVLAWVSITLCSFELMARLGWKRFSVWGWDGSYVDGQDHAFPQPHRSDDIEVDLNGRKFSTTTTWALEAQTATVALAGFPFKIHVHGDGFMPAMLRTFLDKRVMTDSIA